MLLWKFHGANLYVECLNQSVKKEQKMDKSALGSQNRITVNCIKFYTMFRVHVKLYRLFKNLMWFYELFNGFGYESCRLDLVA